MTTHQHHNQGPSRPPVRHGGTDHGSAPTNGHVIRVVSVGSTTLERRLRRVPEVELLRGATLVDAIGELCEPAAHDGDGADSAVRGDPAQPAIVAVAEHALPAPEECGAFAIAARSARPGVRLVTIRPARDGHDDNVSSPGPPPPGFDAVHTDQATLAALLREPPTRAAPPRSDAQPGSDAPEPASSSAPRDEGTLPDLDPHPGAGLEADAPDALDPDDAFDGDAPLVHAALRGRSLRDAAVRLLRSRLGTDRVGFVPAEDPSGPGSRTTTDTHTAAVAGSGGRVVPVERSGRVHGHLRIDAPVSERDARRAAAWMADWLELGRQLTQSRREAHSDPLTGAWNRRYFERYLTRAMAHARENRHALTLLLFDIDDFKSYNDRHGHAAGDEILVETVRLMRASIRPSDRVCRIGGDEFGVIFYEPGGPRDPASKPPASVHQIAQRFQNLVRASCFPKLGMDAPGGLTISGGLATFPWDGHDLKSLVDRADALALEAKRQGKNSITYGPEAVTIPANGPCERDDIPGHPG